MKRIIITFVCMLITTCLWAYDVENDGINEEINVVTEQNVQKNKTIVKRVELSPEMPKYLKDSYQYKAGNYLCKSAKLQYAAIGCGAVSVGCMVLSSTAFKDNSSVEKVGYHTKTTDDTNEVNRKACYITSGVFAVAGFVCELCAISCKMKSGKYLKLSSKTDGVSLAYNF